ncbi:MAG: hypothetical protein ABIM62_01900 [candidate division WOR-3 bacterium]
MGIILSLFVGIISLGFSGDPIASGVSFKIGFEKGLRAHLIMYLDNGEVFVDSLKEIYHPEPGYTETVYRENFWRPYFKINTEIRTEYTFTKKDWFKPYIGMGFGIKNEKNWDTRCEREDTIWTCTPEKVKKNFLGLGIIGGIEFFPLEIISKFLKREISFASTISFDIEIVGYHFLIHKSKGMILDWWEWEYKRKYTGLELSGGIHFNF